MNDAAATESVRASALTAVPAADVSGDLDRETDFALLDRQHERVREAQTVALMMSGAIVDAQDLGADVAPLVTKLGELLATEKKERAEFAKLKTILDRREAQRESQAAAKAVFAALSKTATAH